MQNPTLDEEKDNKLEQTVSQLPVSRKQRKVRERASKGSDGDVERRILQREAQGERRTSLYQLAAPAALLAGGYLLASGISRGSR